MPVTRWNREIFRGEGYGRRYPWIDLVNSEYRDGLGGMTDRLQDAGWRTLFLSVSALSPVSRRPFPTPAFKRLRAHLRIAATQIAEKRTVSPATLRSLNKALSNEVSRSIERDGHRYKIVIGPATSTWSWVAAEITASFAEFLQSNQLHRLKICPNPACRWVFYDESKSNTRRWCNDRRCGNRDKVRRHRARRGLDST
jgi:predicted RNA-binding Zn ribbon-like protein